MRMTIICIILSVFTAVSAFDQSAWHALINDVENEAAAKQTLAAKVLTANAQQTKNQADYDALYYSLDLFPDVNSQILYGNVAMTARALQGGLDRAVLNFLNNMQVDSVFFNGAPAAYTHADHLLTIRFPALAAGEEFTTRVVYHGSPQQSGFGAFAFSSHAGKPMVWTLSEPFGARNWWPCKDIPADKADSMDIKVTVRPDLIVASNGLLRNVIEKEGKKTYWWHERYPIATYLASLAIHPYYTDSDWYVHSGGDSMEVQFYIFPGSVDDARPQNAKTVSMIAAFSEMFGQYPFIKEKYGHAQFLWGGGMEHQTITSLGGYGEALIAHELAHQWWGDMVTCEDFHHIWLNEGFATYSEALWWEYNYGPEALHSDMSFNTYFGDETIYVENPYVENIFNYATTYKKASWVLHMLRHVVGDDTFFEILHTYYEEFKFKTVNTEQFRDLCERVSGMELDQYFQQWIYQGGAPRYQWLWQKEQTADGWLVKVNVKQTQSIGTIFHMPIDLNVQTLLGDHLFVMNNTMHVQDFEFQVPAEPVSVEFDKDNWVLKQAEEIKQPDFVVQNITLYNDRGEMQNSFAAGETGTLVFQAQNLGVSASMVSATLLSEDPAVEIISGKESFDIVQNGEIFSNENQPFIFAVAPTIDGHLAPLQLVFRSEQSLDQKYSLQLPVGEAEVLLVDDDGGADYEKYYKDMAARENIFAEIWSISEQGGVDAAQLSKYPAVVWFTGDEKESTLTHADQAALQNYINAGGHLLLSGQNIGFDLAQNGDEVDAQFFAAVLRAEFIDDQTKDESVVGVPGDELGDRLAMRFNDLYFGAHNQTSTDVISPLEDAVGSFVYLPSMAVAGLRWSDAASGGKIVYLAFGLEGVAGPKVSTAAEVFEKIITWFDSGSSFVDDAANARPTTFVVRQNYPNPFNPQTTVSYYVPENSSIESAIYNIRGQRIRDLGRRFATRGWHRLGWDGLNDQAVAASSGIYFLTIRFKNANISETYSVKMIKIE